MTSTARPIVRRALLALAIVATVTAALIAWTGGGVWRVGGIRVSARGVTNPLLVAGSAWALLAILERRRVARAPAAAWPFIDARAAAIAVVLAATCAGIGVRFNTFAAHATDPSAYVSHSQLLVTGPLVRVEPLAQRYDWYSGAWNFSPLGYRPGVGAAEIVPTYPMGLPAVMAVLRFAFGETGAYLAVPLFGAVLVLACFGLARRLHSPMAGVAAAVLAATSPIAVFHVVQPMSDVPAAAWLVLAILASLGDRWSSGVVAGACLGMVGATRPNLAPIALAVGLCALGWPCRAWRDWRWARAVPVTLGLALVMLPVMALQTRLYGSPWATGYGSLDQYFAWTNIGQNVADYSRRMLVGETPTLWLALVSTVVLVMTRRTPRLTPDGLRASVLVAGLVGAVFVGLYLPYGIFPDWAYLRFLLPALAVAFVAVGALVAEATARLPAGWRGAVLVAATSLVAWGNVRIAENEQAFNLWRYESRYRTVSLYLRETMPANAAVITFQQSGAIRYYTGAPIVRWDYLPNTLDEAVSAVRQAGLHPLLVVEDWERPRLAERFPRSPLAKLDWTPRADIGETTHVWVLDPADREADRPPITDTFK
jgi:hypothetical protein